MRYKRKLSKCSNCALAERTRVWSVGPDKPKLAIFGEAPGKDEDLEGKPFVGAAGRYLSYLLQQAGIYRPSIHISNAISCRPPNNQFNSPEGEEAQECCRLGFEAEIEYLAKQGCKMIICLGKNASEYFGLEGSIHEIRGSVYSYQGMALMPTFHPAYFQYMGWSKSDSRVDMTATVIGDLRKAKEISEDPKPWKPLEERFVMFPKFKDLLEWERSLEPAQLLACDIETTSLNPEYAEIVVIGFATSAEDGISVPLLAQGDVEYWSNGERHKVYQFLNRIFQNHPLMFQNSLYDVNILRGLGYAINFERVGEDIMLLHHAISPELPHNLGFIVSHYGKTPYWKKDLLQRSGSIFELDDETLRRYNLRDCVVLFQVLGPMLEDAKKQKTLDIYRNESLKLLGPIGDISYHGIKFSQAKLKAFKNKVRKDANELDRKLRDVGQLPEAFNLGSDDDLRWLLFGVKPNKFKLVKKFDKRTEKDKETWNCENQECERVRFATVAGEEAPLCPVCGKPGHPTKTRKGIEAIRSIRDNTRQLYRPVGFKGRRTEKGSKIMVAEQGRVSLRIAVQNRLEMLKKFKHPSEKHKKEAALCQKTIEFLALYDEWAHLNKLETTYTDFKTDSNGRLHTSLLIHGTATGRLSSSKPNLQNIPAREEKRGNEIRDCFVAEPGYKLLSRDYSNLEVRVIALESEDWELWNFLEKGGNVHDLNTKLMFSIDESHPNWKTLRNVAKTYFFGRISYGGSDNEIYQRMLIQCPRAGITFSKVKKLASKYLEAHPPYGKWYGKIAATIEGTRETSTFRGRKRILYGPKKSLLKEALNTPIQGGAAHIINEATIRSHKKLKGKKSRLVLQVHDELIFEVHNSEWDEIVAMTKEEMERPVNYRGKIVVFPTEAKGGLSWGSMTKISEKTG